MASLTNFTTHSQLYSFTNASLPLAVDARNEAITDLEDAVTSNQQVDTAFEETIFDGTNWNIVVTVKTITNNIPTT